VTDSPENLAEDVAGGTEGERVQRLAEIFGRLDEAGDLIADATRRANERLAGQESGELELGIGDDAAVLRPARGTRLVWTVDTQVENVHFRRAWVSFRDLGYRSFVAAASDVSAMGGSPWCALSALSLPLSLTDRELEEVARGQKEAADAVGARVLGGNMSKGEVVTVTTTLLGKATRALARSGAKVGDGLWVAGDLGLAAAGLAALERGATGSAVDAAVEAWRRPKPRVAEGLAMSLSAHAAIDVSDGLALDAGRIAEASRVSVVLDEELLVSRAGEGLARAAETVGANAFDLILGGGEDYALLAASTVPIGGFFRVGEFCEGRGVVVRRAHGDDRLHDLGGFDHFRKR
jgi:thiamine-monophosphate kinase